MQCRTFYQARTMDTQLRHKSKISEKLGRCGRQNMLRPYLKILDWDWIFGRAVKAISSLGVRSPCPRDQENSTSTYVLTLVWNCKLYKADHQFWRMSEKIESIAIEPNGDSSNFTDKIPNKCRIGKFDAKAR